VLTLSAPIDLNDPSAPADALPPASSVTASVATDTAGNRQARAAARSFTVERRR